MKVEWKQIKGFDSYFINEEGQVKSTRSFKGTQERILKPSKNQQGYITYNLIRGGKVFRKPLHRLLMETYKPNKENLPCINHIDGNILNNSLDNLEWCTYSHNNKEAYRLGLKEPRIKAKKIKQLDKEGNIINIWNSSYEPKILGFSPSSINMCCNGKRKTANGYVWRFVNE